VEARQRRCLRRAIYRLTAQILSGGGAGLNGEVGLAPVSDLYIADVASGSLTMLAKAMGYTTPADVMSHKTYLPFPDDDQDHTYFPTMSPVAAGGYFWLFFDAMRHYGSLGLQRQLWGVAIDIQAGAPSLLAEHWRDVTRV
jgi:hypothetical protein